MTKIILSLNTQVTNLLSPRYDVFDVVMEQNFLAIQRAKKFYPEAEIILYTDHVGSQIFKDICTIKLLNPDRVKHYFSEAKIEVLEREEGEFIHIDGDLFLNGRLKYHPKVDVIIDHNEINIWDSHYKEMFDLFTQHGVKEIFPEWEEVPYIFNVGVLGFFSEELKKEYLEIFHKLKKFHQSIKHKLPFFGLITLILVQYSLSILAQKKRYKFDFTEYKSDYLHLYGKRKFFKKNVDWIRKEIKTYSDYSIFKNNLESYDKDSVVFRQFTSYE
jgi:hypothetical protein